MIVTIPQLGTLLRIDARGWMAREVVGEKLAEGFCPKRKDGSHCVHWWDGGDACCSCGYGKRLRRLLIFPRRLRRKR